MTECAFHRGYIEHARTDVPALATFTVSNHRVSQITERAARCDIPTVKVPAESAGAVSRANCTLDLRRGPIVGDPTNLLVLLVYLQGAAAIFSVRRHHHRGPFHEGRSLTHALTDTAPTELTVA